VRAVPEARFQRWVVQRSNGGREESKGTPKVIPPFVRLRDEDGGEN
jgi:hypothetical protein